MEHIILRTRCGCSQFAKLPASLQPYLDVPLENPPPPLVTGIGHINPNEVRRFMWVGDVDSETGLRIFREV